MAGAPGTPPWRYQRVVPQAGRYNSEELGLDLAVQGGSLRFFYGIGELIGSDDLIGRLTGMVEGLTAKADAAEVETLRGAVLTVLEVRGRGAGRRRGVTSAASSARDDAGPLGRAVKAAPGA